MGRTTSSSRTFSSSKRPVTPVIVNYPFKLRCPANTKISGMSIYGIGGKLYGMGNLSCSSIKNNELIQSSVGVYGHKRGAEYVLKPKDPKDYIRYMDNLKAKQLNTFNVNYADFRSIDNMDIPPYDINTYEINDRVYMLTYDKTSDGDLVGISGETNINGLSINSFDTILDGKEKTITPTVLYYTGKNTDGSIKMSPEPLLLKGIQYDTWKWIVTGIVRFLMLFLTIAYIYYYKSEEFIDLIFYIANVPRPKL